MTLQIIPTNQPCYFPVRLAHHDKHGNPLPKPRKQPVETGWQSNLSFWNEPKIQNHLAAGGLVGMATGKPSGLAVVDVDVMALNQLALNKCGATGYVMRTQSGGIHYYYAVPAGEHVGNRTAWLKLNEGDLRGVDVRGDGGFVVVAGTGYELLHGESPAFLHLPLINEINGGTDAENKLQYRQKIQITQNLINALYCLHGLTYEEWSRVGMGLYHSCEDNQAALRLYQEWSQQCEAADEQHRVMSPDDIAEKWLTFERNPNARKVTVMSSIYHLARDRFGWQGEIDDFKIDPAAAFGDPSQYTFELPKTFDITPETTNFSQAAIDIGNDMKRIYELSQLVGVTIDIAQIDYIINRCFFETQKRKCVQMVKPDGKPTTCTDDEFAKGALNTFKTPVPNLEKAMDMCNITDRAERRKIRAISYNCMLNHIKRDRQINGHQRITCLFSTEFTSELKPNSDGLSMQGIFYDPFELPVIEAFEPDPTIMAQVVTDYKEHMPQFDDLIKFTVASRYAFDRKNAFLWIHAVSNFGKSGLKKMFNDLGLWANMTTADAIKLVDGDTTKLETGDFTNSFTICIDEAEGAPADLRKLDNNVEMNIKFKSGADVPVYGKVLLSADEIPVLMGEDGGVDDQFINRFNYMRFEVNFTQRQLPVQLGEDVYQLYLTQYIRECISATVTRYQQTGKTEAAREAQRYLTYFHDQYGIGRSFESVSDNVEEIAEDWLEWVGAMIRQKQPVLNGRCLERFVNYGDIHNQAGQMFIAPARSIYDAWVKTHPRAQQAKLKTLYKSIHRTLSTLDQFARPRHHTKKVMVNGISKRALITEQLVKHLTNL